MKKIKKEIPIVPVQTNGFDVVNFIKTSKDSKRDSLASLSSDKMKPSTKGIFIQWKKKFIDIWDIYDFIGFYLSTYLEVIGSESPEFICRKKSDKFVIEVSKIKSYLEEYFDENNRLLKQYIEFIIPWWISDESFVDKTPNFYSIFGPKGYFIKEFVLSKEKTVVKKKKVVKNRKEADNKFASKSAWDNYFEKKGE